MLVCFVSTPIISFLLCFIWFSYLLSSIQRVPLRGGTRVGGGGHQRRCESVSITSLGVTAAGTSVNRCDPGNTAPRCRRAHLLSPQKPGNDLLGSTGGGHFLSKKE